MFGERHPTKEDDQAARIPESRISNDPKTKLDERVPEAYLVFCLEFTARFRV